MEDSGILLGACELRLQNTDFDFTTRRQINPQIGPSMILHHQSIGAQTEKTGPHRKMSSFFFPFLKIKAIKKEYNMNDWP